MEKYGVVIDPKKLKKTKEAHVKKSPDDDESNVPLDPETGTRDYEKRPEEDDEET
jgi:hypothetical protein